MVRGYWVKYMLGSLGVRRVVEAEQKEQRIPCELTNQHSCISHSASKEDAAAMERIRSREGSHSDTVMVGVGEFDIVDQMVYVLTTHGSICEARFRWLSQ